jgi:hypothetical protein
MAVTLVLTPSYPMRTRSFEPTGIKSSMTGVFTLARARARAASLLPHTYERCGLNVLNED